MIVSNFLQEIKKQTKISNQVRLYVIDKNKHYFLNDGVLKNGFNSKLTIIKNRDSVLSGFSKMAFLFDEIIRLRIISYSNQKDNKELLYLLNLVPINRKIRAFLDWGVFSPEYTRNMSRLFEVRNDTVHCVSLDEVRYNPKTPISLSRVNGFKKFKTDMCKAWDDLLKIYLNQQANIDWIALSKEVKITP